LCITPIQNIVFLFVFLGIYFNIDITIPKGLYSYYTFNIFVSIMKQKTTICIEHTTLDKLKELKIAKRESYDEVINRIVERIK